MIEDQASREVVCAEKTREFARVEGTPRFRLRGLSSEGVGTDRK
jgi:hypothetical protein